MADTRPINKSASRENCDDGSSRPPRPRLAAHRPTRAHSPAVARVVIDVVRVRRGDVRDGAEQEVARVHVVRRAVLVVAGRPLVVLVVNLRGDRGRGGGVDSRACMASCRSRSSVMPRATRTGSTHLPLIAQPRVNGLQQVQVVGAARDRMQRAQGESPLVRCQVAGVARRPKARTCRCRTTASRPSWTGGGSRRPSSRPRCSAPW